jgi:hypothetical protein
LIDPVIVNRVPAGVEVGVGVGVEATEGGAETPGDGLVALVTRAIEPQAIVSTAARPAIATWRVIG